MAIKTTRIIITGIVQGVGFRPFLFRTITKFDPNIRGTIRNSGNLGVILDLALEQGQPQWIQLMERIEENRPEMAFVEKIYQDQMPEETKNKLSIMNNLKIVKSDDLTGKSVVLPPDIGMCEDCLEEFKVKGDPRWGNYEFI